MTRSVSSLLVFDDREQEAGYRRTFAQQRLRLETLWSVTTAALTLVQVLVEHGVDEPAVAVTVVTLQLFKQLAQCAVYALQWWRPQRSFALWRQGFQLLDRLERMLAWPPHSAWAPKGRSCAKLQYSAFHAVVGQCSLAVLQPMQFATHAWVQPITAAALIGTALREGGICSAMQDSCAGMGTTPMTLSSMWYRIILMMLPGHGMLLPEGSLDVECREGAVVLVLAFVLLLPLAIVYNVERKSRRSYLKCRRKWPIQGLRRAADDLPFYSVMLQGLLLVSIAATLGLAAGGRGFYFTAV